MKKIFTPLLITATLLIASSSFGQAYNNSIDMGIRGNACDQLVIEWNSSYNFTGAENAWSQATMTITWDQALGANVLGTITSLLPGFTGWQYNGVAALVGTEYRHEVILISGGYNQDIPIGVTEVLTITLNGTGTGTFTLADPVGNTNISNGLLGTNIWSGVFNPNPATGVSLDDKIVWNGTEWCGGSGTNNQPGAGDTQPCFVTGLGGQLTVWGATVGSLDVQLGGELSIMPGASLTNTGNTTIAQPQGLIIAADASGSGSYIDNGTINYIGSGSAKVQTYIANTATPGNFHIHQIGPTVKNPSFSTTFPGESGVFLGEFDLTAGGTYAYRYSEPINNWVNFWQTTDPVPTASGFIFSDVSGAPSTLEMAGQLATDDGGVTTFIATPSASITPGLSQWAITYTPAGGMGNFLTSNPYPSGLDLKDFWLIGYGSSYLGSVMRIWDPVAGSYATMTRKVTPPPAGWLYTNAFNGTNGLINPGQAFFVEALSTYIPTYGDQLYFVSGYRDHYHGPFIKEASETDANTLTGTMTNEYYKDQLIVYFAEELSSGIDYYDAEKWPSMYDDGIDISSLSSDQVALTVNAMPELTNMASIPISFKPGITTDFTFEFSGVDSFEPGTEIYLEDLQTGAPWINLLSNPVYQFSGNTDDPENRFVLHFFGPTGIGDPGAEISPVQIYSYDHDAYIVNRGNEVIEEYVVYDMMGRELQRGSLPSTTVNKVFIGQVSGYYIVKVVTNSRIYSEKVFINR